MNTDELIQALAKDVKPVPRHAVGRRLAIGIGAGAILALVPIVWLLGLNPQLALAIQHYSFWMKWGYTVSLGSCAVVATARLARPDSGKLGWMWLMVIPVLSLAVIGLFEMSRAPPTQWLAMWLGHSWTVCSSLVFLLSMPIFGGLLWSFRHLAPTRLRAAGATAGLTAGAWGATLYCLHCPEVSAIFVLTWYTLGIGLAALAGALVGPRLLRW
ncbi:MULTISPECIES: DUF1109 domain-containing protein [unclassified Novosphingobium]|uniref:DUF1109 domain-containing protein n=1 Tax=Novosphingobium TaxID=165696 RepID=UPI00146A3F36|nr:MULTISPECIES: DUF1109 domain-containing protein [unclassified Novosphingobium]NMN04728.1 hypothetical protein [Novosphingobium sp. SG919]NMN85278.1 hypothetical protein [Novosphingobium sp. SG916]